MRNLKIILDKAKEQAELSDHPTFKLGAVIFTKRGRILSVGHNWLFKTHPLIRRYDEHKTLHAECHAILSYPHKDKLKGAEIFVYRKAKGGMANAKPCPCCMSIIKLFGIKRVWYSIENAIGVFKV